MITKKQLKDDIITYDIIKYKDNLETKISNTSIAKAIFIIWIAGILILATFYLIEMIKLKIKIERPRPGLTDARQSRQGTFCIFSKEDRSSCIKAIWKTIL